MPHDVRIFSCQGMPKGRFCSKSKRVEQRCVQPASITAVTRGSCFKEPLEHVLQANVEVIFLRVAVAVLTFDIGICTKVVGTLPVGRQTVVDARAVDALGLDGLDRLIGTHITDVLVAQELMVQTTREGNLEVARIVKRT